MVNASFLKEDEVQLLKERNSSIVYCPITTRRYHYKSDIIVTTLISIIEISTVKRCMLTSMTGYREV